ncbi:major facilitator superfamily domain-containing protein [Aspergillus multicolor]|uniref:major facilitator superfamily domain-containing protein n=1 Tax=Aspergillus multicolor TaxID=41759 RepID=UPI003CCCC6AA
MNAQQPPAPQQTPASQPQATQPLARSWRFWAIFPPLCVAALLPALDLNAGAEYTWFIDGYLLTSTVFIPFYGRFAQVFGRRWPTMLAVAIFTLGSGISGGANSPVMLITGRLVQGLGGAGISTMVNLIISDLVSVRDRGKYQGIIFGMFGIGISIGPVIRGAIAQSGHWGWVFYLNLPVGGIVLVLQFFFFFLQITHRKTVTIKQKMKQVDWIGNLLLITAMIAILIALSWADTAYDWSSWHILVPFLIGIAGMVGFHVFESTPYARVPTIPNRLFENRTSTVTLLGTFLSSMLTFWRSYFLPIYFQSVLLVSPQRSGVLLLPSVLIAAPPAVFAGFALSHWGKYKPIHMLGYGLGALPHADLVPATATWGYLRSFGSVWGIAISSAIFNSRFAHYLRRVSDEQGQVIAAYTSALVNVWEVCLAFSAVAFLLSLMEKGIPMRTAHQSEYGLKEKKAAVTPANAAKSYAIEPRASNAVSERRPEGG